MVPPPVKHHHNKFVVAVKCFNTPPPSSFVTVKQLMRRDLKRNDLRLGDENFPTAPSRLSVCSFATIAIQRGRPEWGRSSAGSKTPNLNFVLTAVVGPIIIVFTTLKPLFYSSTAVFHAVCLTAG